MNDPVFTSFNHVKKDAKVTILWVARCILIQQKIVPENLISVLVD